MADTAFQTMYRQELVIGFERRQSLLRNTVTTEGQVKGNSLVFDVNTSNSGTAVTRGTDGFIPAAQNADSQLTCTLVEWHDLRRKTDFNIFASQGDQRASMQLQSMGVINRKIDSDILTALATGTVNTGAAVTATPQLVLKALTILQNSNVPWDSNITLVASPAMGAYLAMAPEFRSIDYVGRKSWETGDPTWRDQPISYIWNGMTVIVHPGVSGAGTNAEKCYLYHKAAIGHGYDSRGIDSEVGYVGEHRYSWARTTVYMGSKVLQNSGIVVINHDGSALVAA